MRFVGFTTEPAANRGDNEHKSHAYGALEVRKLTMSRQQRWLWLFLVWLALLSTPVLAQSQATTTLRKLSLQDTPKALVDEVWQTVDREFADHSFNNLDWQQVRRDLLAREYTSREDAYQVLRTTLKKLGDPYTRFLTPREYQNLLEQTNGEWIGIGMTLGTNEDTGAPVIVRVFPDSPASGDGLQLKDQLLAVDGQSVAGLSLDAVTQRIRGDKDTTVTLALLRGGSQKLTVTLKRSPIELPVVSAQLKQEGLYKIGYLRLEEFSGKAPAEMRTAIERLKGEGAQGWILDLRGNPGGRVDAAAEITSLLMQQGTIVMATNRNGERETLQADRRAITGLPLVVLVDRGSASASEIVAGALQDNRRARLVGTITFGKGVIQQMNTLSDGSGLNVTIARYQTPAGREIHKKGLVPDVLVPMAEGLRQQLVATDAFAGDADTQYRRAVSELTGELQPSAPGASTLEAGKSEANPIH